MARDEVVDGMLRNEIQPLAITSRTSPKIIFVLLILVQINR